MNGSHVDEPVYGITTAERSHSEDISRRQKQYTLTMLFRMVSVIVVVWVPGISWPVKIVLGLVATVIPYVAVVRANGGPMPEKDPTNLLLAAPPKDAIGAGRGPLPDGAGGWREPADGADADGAAGPAGD